MFNRREQKENLDVFELFKLFIFKHKSLELMLQYQIVKLGLEVVFLKTMNMVE